MRARIMLLMMVLAPLILEACKNSNQLGFN
jgi:hypothetical protein